MMSGRGSQRCDRIRTIRLFLPLLLLAALTAPAAFGAEATIDATTGTTSIPMHSKRPALVFISDQTGYAFYRDGGGSNDCFYAKTTNGGATWVTGASLMAGDCRGIAVWYDRWTPGDTTGTYIHLAMLDLTGDDGIYDRLDTANDTALGNALVFDVAGTIISSDDKVSITKATDGALYLGVSDGSVVGSSGVRKCSATCGTAGNWSNAGTPPLDDDDDAICLLPLSGGNVLLIRQDITAEDIQSQVYTSGTASWTGSWTTLDANAADSTSYPNALAATLKTSDNTIYLAYGADVGLSTADIRTAVYSGGAWTAKTDVVTNVNTMLGADIALDQNTGELYVVYLGGTAGSAVNAYYKKSTNGMTSWGPETQFNTTNTDLTNVYTVPMSNERIYGAYRQNTATDDGLFGDTIADLVSNQAPNAPSSLSPATGSATNDNTPTLSFTQSDPDGADTEKFQILIDDNADFSSPTVDYTSALIAQGATSFTVGQAAGGGTYNGGVGSEGQTLAAGTYSWKVRSTDNSSSTGSYSSTLTFTVDTTAPTCNTRETADLDNDGYVDALYLTCSELILDSSIQASDFDVSVVTGEAFISTTNGDTADDADFYLTFTDGVSHTGVTPTLTYTQDSPTDNDVTDAAGNKLANLVTVATTDKAAPVVTAIETADLNTSGYLDAVRIVFSENVKDSATSSVVANDFDVSGVTGEAFSSTTNGDVADDNDIYLTFTDGVHTTAATPTVTYTQDSPTDNDVTDLSPAANKLANLNKQAGQVWWDTAWLNRVKITFDNDQANTENLTNFPVLVVLNANRIDYAKTKNLGEDLRFLDASHTAGAAALAHEIEKWDEAGTSYVWVKVPQVDSGSTSDHLWLYYNNTGAADGQSATAVWSNGYVGVWHLKEDPSGTAPQAKDATSNANHATSTGTMTSTDQVAAQVDGGIDFDGVDDRLDAGSGASIDDILQTGGTWSAWIYPRGWGANSIGKIVYKRTVADAAHLALCNDATECNVRSMYCFQTFSSLEGRWSTPTDSIVLNTWQHVVMTYNKGSSANDPVFYINGSSKTVTENATPSGTAASDAAANLYIGNKETSLYAFNGVIDEVRGSNVIRTAAWIAAEYKTGADTFNTYGSEESQATDSQVWWDTAWVNRIKVSFDNTRGTTENLANFPVLIKLTSSDIDYGKTQNAGQDLRFLDAGHTAGATALAHEIEKWDEAGTSYVWVKVPQIDQSSRADHLWLYYNNTGAADAQSATAVWSNGYVGVWHLKEDPSGTAPQMKDSTSNARHGTSGGTMTTTDQVAAKVDGGLDLDGTDDYVNTSSALSNFISASDGTMTVWMRPTGAAVSSTVVYGLPAIIQDSDGTANSGFVGIHRGSVGGLDRIWVYNWDGNADSVGMTYTNDEWVHIAWRHGGGTLFGYKNGAQDVSVASGNTAGLTVPVIFGRNYSALQFFNGLLDEVRIANVARTAAWIAAEYRTQKGIFHTSSGAQSVGTAVATTDKAGPAILSAVTKDVNANGKLDAVEITASEPVKDASATGSGGYDVASFAGEAFAAFGTANDAVFRVTFTEGASVDTSLVPAITVSSATLTDNLASGANAAPNQTFSATADGAPPVLKSAAGFNAGTAGLFNAVGDQLDLLFSEAVAAAPTEANSETNFLFAGGATDGDNFPTEVGGQTIIARATTTLTNDTLRYTFSASDTANVNLLTPGTHTVDVNVGGVVANSIEDAAGNDLVDTATGAALTITVLNQAPNAPSSLSPATGSATNDNTPTLSFTQSDPDGADTVKFQILIDDNADFSSPTVDYTSALIAQGATSFTVGQAAGGGTYNGGVGSEGQTLTDGTTYSWKVRSTDNSNLTGNYSGTLTFTVDTTAPTCATRETADLDNDGYVDALYLTCSELILDSSIQASDFDVSGVTGEAFISTTNGDTADDADFYLTFTDGVSHSGITPTLTYTQSGATDVSDLAGNKLANLSAVATTDKAKPALLQAKGNLESGKTIFDAVGERLDLRFSETLTAPTEANLEAALTFAGGATDSGNNLPDIGTGVNPVTLVTTVVSNDTVRVTRNTNNADSGAGQLLTLGTHTVQVTTGTNITDASAAANQANTAPAAVTVGAADVITSGSVTYSDGVDAGGGDVGWDQVSWNDTETTGSILYQVEFYNGSVWALIPDAALTGNSAGFGTSPIDISGLDVTTYNLLRLKATFTYSGGGTPILNDWTISWKRRPTSSGSAGSPLIY